MFLILLMPLKYQRYLKPYARALRNNSTLGEIILWNELKQKKINGYQFYRQRPLLEYIVDFYCPSLKLIIEIDGKYHNQGDDQINDDIRQEKLEALGLKFLRFTEVDVMKKLGFVLECIEDFIDGINPPVISDSV
jgi:very-short-patch-repair endonuclease